MSKVKAPIMPNALLERLRECVQPKGKKALMLRDLPDSFIVDVYQRLKLGQSAHHIAEYLQTKRNVFVAISTVSLANIIQIFKKRAIPEMIQVKQELQDKPELKKSVVKRVEQVTKKLDALELLADINHDLWERYKGMRTIEEEQSIRFDETLPTYKTLEASLHNYHERLCKLGIVETKPSEHLVHFDATFTQMVKQLPDKGANLPQIAERICELVEKDAVELEAFPDGTYRLKNTKE